MTRPGYRVVSISDEIAREVRQTGKSPGYGHPATVEVADGHGPCRSCLHRFAEGTEKRILFTHDPFAGFEPYPLPGPVYIHERACVPYQSHEGFPAELRDKRLTFNAYGHGRRVLAQRRIDDGTADETISALLADPEVGYLHVRSTDAGCFICRIER